MTDVSLVGRAGGLLQVFNEAGVLAAADVHVARRLASLGRESAEPVLLAAAMAVRAVRLGAVCVDLRALREVRVEDADVAALPWPEHDEVVDALRRSPLVAGSAAGPLRPLRLLDTDRGELLYLDRYWRQEQTIRQVLDDRARTHPPYDAKVLAAGLAARFGDAPDRQRIAAALAVTRWTSIVAGGPGTGKTYTVARILLLLQEQQPDVRIALAAPTGKAAARLQEQVNEQGVALFAMTLHRLLGWRPDSRTRFRHDAGNRLPYDVVVVDETSMVSLTMMARLLEALRLDSRLVLVGDPDQLASVDAGAVLADLVARPVPATGDAGLDKLIAADLEARDDPNEVALTTSERERLRNGVVRLSRGRRFNKTIANLAVAVRDGDADGAMAVLTSGKPEVSFVGFDDLAGLHDDVVSSAKAVTVAARDGDVSGALTGLELHRLLCAHRTGSAGVRDWDRRAREWVEAALGQQLDPSRFFAGQPLLVTTNDYEAKVYNGDTGVVVERPDGTLVAAFARAGEPVLRHPGALAAVQTVYAMTIHRSQGSQYKTVSVVLPPTASALLTRELLYTAVTRAQQHVRVIGTEESVRAGIERQVLRASGLRRIVHA
ncbi:MAG: exodeoxyribonuclease V subunit alpha [Actinobacteria bacterium]|nr:exodeoxyribonuclease V subunit alpha [Actinomycetota bacterium]